MTCNATDFSMLTRIQGVLLMADWVLIALAAFYAT